MGSAHDRMTTAGAREAQALAQPDKPLAIANARQQAGGVDRAPAVRSKAASSAACQPAQSPFLGQGLRDSGAAHENDDGRRGWSFVAVVCRACRGAVARLPARLLRLSCRPLRRGAQQPRVPGGLPRRAARREREDEGERMYGAPRYAPPPRGDFGAPPPYRPPYEPRYRQPPSLPNVRGLETAQGLHVLAAHGYGQVGARGFGAAVVAFYFNRATGGCLQIVYTNGRVNDVQPSADRSCR